MDSSNSRLNTNIELATLKIPSYFTRQTNYSFELNNVLKIVKLPISVQKGPRPWGYPGQIAKKHIL
jgi:hypothetical protein